MESDSHFKQQPFKVHSHFTSMNTTMMIPHETAFCLFVYSNSPLASFASAYSLQGILISHNASARVIRSNQSLVLQKVTRNSSGNYSCSAINAEGETVSNQLPLRVKCKCFSFLFVCLKSLSPQLPFQAREIVEKLLSLLL